MGEEEAVPAKKKLALSLGKESINYIIMGVLALVAVAIFGWKMVSDSAAQAELEAMRTDLNSQLESARRVAATQLTKAKEESQQQLRLQTEGLLRFSAIPLGLLARTEMLNKNIKALTEYVDLLVKEPNVLGVVMADATGTIVAASDRNLDQQPIDAVFPVEYTQIQRVTVKESEDGNLHVVSPVMGLSEKMGTVVVVYSKDAALPATSAAPAPAAPAQVAPAETAPAAQ
ncbi:MAG: hypothetical protein ACREUA_10990 [Burkholderiales bacterium]